LASAILCAELPVRQNTGYIDGQKQLCYFNITHVYYITYCVITISSGQWYQSMDAIQTHTWE